MPSLADIGAAWALFQDAILCAAIAGVVLGWLAVHIVLRRMVFVSATLSQASALGVCLAFFAEIDFALHLPPLIAALLVGAGAVALVSLNAESVGLSRESLLAFAWLIPGAGAILVGQHISQEAQDVNAILYGTAVLVRPEDLYTVAALGGAVLVIALVIHNGLVATGFDPDGARVQGLPVRALELALPLLITVIVAAATRALGALPVFAFSVLPGMAGLLLTNSLRSAFPAAAVVGGLSGALGFVAAFLFDLPVGAAQAATAAVFVLLSIPIRVLRGSR